MKIIRIAILAIATAVTSLAFAGLATPAAIIVTLNPDGSGSALGDMLTARYSRNDVEFIGCGIRVLVLDNGTIFSLGFCQAGDADGNEAFCSAQNAELLTAIHAATDYSFVSFSFDDAGQCTRIGFSTQSFYLPNKVHKPSR